MTTKLQEVGKQLTQWPPTSSTIYGGAILLGLGSYMLTGSWELMVGLGGAIKMVCPQSAPQIDAALKEDQSLMVGFEAPASAPASKS